MKKNILAIAAIALLALTSCGGNKESSEVHPKKVMIDLAHGQFQDVFVAPSYYDYVLPGYEEIAQNEGFEIVRNTVEITAESLRDIDALLVISPLARKTQIPFTAAEKQAITQYIQQGGAAIFFVDEESHRVILDEYGVNDITMPFGIEVLDDFDAPGNCGAISFENEIFGGRREIPCSGQRSVRGGIPASVCMEGGWQISAFTRTANGGKLYVAGETMVALLMGLPDGDRNVHNMIQTRWWGKDSRLYMSELLRWAIK